MTRSCGRDSGRLQRSCPPQAGIKPRRSAPARIPPGEQSEHLAADEPDRRPGCRRCRCRRAGGERATAPDPVVVEPLEAASRHRAARRRSRRGRAAEREAGCASRSRAGLSGRAEKRGPRRGACSSRSRARRGGRSSRTGSARAPRPSLRRPSPRRAACLALGARPGAGSATRRPRSCSSRHQTRARRAGRRAAAPSAALRRRRAAHVNDELSPDVADAHRAEHLRRLGELARPARCAARSATVSQSAGSRRSSAFH